MTSNEKWYPPYIFFLCIISVFFVGCIGNEDATVIDLNEIDTTIEIQPNIPPLKIAVSAMISPKETLVHYEDLLDYISKRTGRPVELVQRKTYAEVNELLESQELDAAFVCTGAYVDGCEKFGMELLVAPVVNGEPYYYSYIIVPDGSDANSKNPEYTSKTKVIARSQPYGIPPVVVHPDSNPEIKTELQDILLTMHNDPMGADILMNIGIDKFTIVDESIYDPVYEMREFAEAQDAAEE